MIKGKRMAENSKESNTKTKIFILLLILLVIISCVIYYFFNVKYKNKSSVSTVANSQIEQSKYIQGLEDIKILGINVENSNDTASIKIEIYNTSNQKFTSQKTHLYLLDDSDRVIFGSSLKIPDIEANSQINFSIACSGSIENVANYEIVLE